MFFSNLRNKILKSRSKRKYYVLLMEDGQFMKNILTYNPMRHDETQEPKGKIQWPTFSSRRWPISWKWRIKLLFSIQFLHLSGLKIWDSHVSQNLEILHLLEMHSVFDTDRTKESGQAQACLLQIAPSSAVQSVSFSQ